MVLSACLHLCDGCGGCGVTGAVGFGGRMGHVGHLYMVAQRMYAAGAVDVCVCVCVSGVVTAQARRQQAPTRPQYSHHP